MQERSVQQFKPWLCAVVPWVFLMGMYSFFSLPFPYLDQWEFPLFLVKYYDGTLGFGDFWGQHNEHRLIFPRLLMLGMAVATDWNIYFELAVNFLLGSLLFVLCCLFLRATQHGAIRMPWFIAILAPLIFSLSQWGNWFLGWQLQVFLNLVAVAGTFLLLADPKQGLLRYFGAMVLAVVATYSFANGLLVWPLGAILIGLAATKISRGLYFRLALWVLLGTVVAGTYLYGYESPEHHPPLSSIFEKFLQFPLYVFGYLGQPILNFSHVGAVISGGMGLAIFSTLIYKMMKEQRVPLGALGLCFVFGAYAIASALITGVARIGDPAGSAQALSSRYATIANLLWVANIGLVSLWCATREAADSVDLLRRYAKQIAFAFVFLVLASSLHGAYRWTERYHAYQVFYWSDDVAQRGRIYPDVAKLKAMQDILRQHGLSVYKGGRSGDAENGR